MTAVLILFTLVSCAGLLIQSFVGFAGSLFAVPLFCFFLPPSEAVPAYNMVMLVVDVFLIYECRKTIHWRHLRGVLPGGLIGVPIDFNSTKYDCDWATLAGSDGHGIGVVFAPVARHHCRAGTSTDGSRVLVVNRQCSPPRDLSSGIVPDYYLTFKRGERASGEFGVGAQLEQRRAL